MPAPALPPIVLASSSPYRRELLAKLQLTFECYTPAIDETPLPDELASDLVTRLSQQKARSVAQHYPQHLIIGSDQAASLQGEILGKPGSHSAALEQLSACSGKVVTFYTAVCLLNSQTGTMQNSVVPFEVSFRPLNRATIERYLRAETPYDCAGSFKAEGLGIALFETLHGDDHNALIGLPLIALVTMLAREQVVIP